MTKEELKEKGYDIYSYDNGDYQYTDKKGIDHLFREGKEIAKGFNVHSYDNGDYEYEDDSGIYHLFRDGKELLVCGWIEEIRDGVYKCETTDTTHNFNEGNKNE